MVMGKVVGRIVSTKKQESLVGYTILEVQLVENQKETDKFMVAFDSVGAGIGELVLITTGSGARFATHNPNAPVDAVVVGIVD